MVPAHFYEVDGKLSYYATRPLSRWYLRSYLVKKYCRSSPRAQQEIQEQSSNTEEQELRAMPN